MKQWKQGTRIKNQESRKTQRFREFWIFLNFVEDKQTNPERKRSETNERTQRFQREKADLRKRKQDSDLEQSSQRKWTIMGTLPEQIEWLSI